MFVSDKSGDAGQVFSQPICLPRKLFNRWLLLMLLELLFGATFLVQAELSGLRGNLGIHDPSCTLTVSEAWPHEERTNPSGGAGVPAASPAILIKPLLKGAS